MQDECRIDRRSFAGQNLAPPRAHFFPDTSTTVAPNAIFPPSEYFPTAAITSVLILKAYLSAGTRSSSGRKGTATPCACSHTSSAVPGQVQGSVFVSSSMSPNPALRKTVGRLPLSA